MCHFIQQSKTLLPNTQHYKKYKPSLEVYVSQQFRANNSLAYRYKKQSQQFIKYN